MKTILCLGTVFTLYLTPYCHFVMPTAPDPVLPTGQPSAPAAPPAVQGGGAGNTPPAPVVVVPPWGGGAPDAPPPVQDRWSQGGSDAVLGLSGTISPAIDGLVAAVSGPLDVLTLATWAGARSWSTDGTGVKNSAGLWVLLYAEYFVTLADATLDEILPPGNYHAADWYASGQANVQFAGPDYYGSHYCYSTGGPAKWTDPGVATDIGSMWIPAGTKMRFATTGVDVDFSGGLAATWQASPSAQWIWRQKAFYNGSTINYTATWRGDTPSLTPLDAGPWAASGTPAPTGTFILAAMGGVRVPDAIQSTGLPSAPPAPAAIQSGGLPSAPAAPSAVQP